MFKQLEQHFVRSIGPDALSQLQSSLTPAVRILTIGGDQLTGKSTLARDLAVHLHAPYVSAGSYFRAVAKERGLNVAELSKLAASKDGDASIDVRIEFETCRTIMSGLVNGAPAVLTSGAPAPTKTIILEGRNPAVMAAYCRTLGKAEVMSLYLSCSPRVQARRFVGREIDRELSFTVDALLHSAATATAAAAEPAAAAAALATAFGSIESVAAALESVAAREPAGLEAAVHAAAAKRGIDVSAADSPARGWTGARLAAVARELAMTQSRDEDDRRRFLGLYGLPPQLDYRAPSLYDRVIDTSEHSPVCTLDEVLAFLAGTPLGRAMIDDAEIGRRAEAKL